MARLTKKQKEAKNQNFDQVTKHVATLLKKKRQSIYNDKKTKSFLQYLIIVAI